MKTKLRITRDLIKSLPKTELHCHLDGSIRLESLIQEARCQKVRLPSTDPDTLKDKLQLGKKVGSLVNYLKAFDTTLSVMQNEEAISRFAFELAEDNAKENVQWLEVRFSPILHTKKGLSLQKVMNAVIAGLKQAEKQYSILTGIIICGIRNINPETSVELAKLSVEYKDNYVVAFDLAGAEMDFPAKQHIEAFSIILNNNINCTAHAGEAYGARSIHQAIHYCGAHRIGHGTRLKEDEKLLNYVSDHRIPLEICLKSNLQTGAISTLKNHPMKYYFDFGIRTTLNTDNRLITDTTLTDEYWIAYKDLGFSFDQLCDIILYGFKSAFLPYRKRKELLNQTTLALLRYRLKPE